MTPPPTPPAASAPPVPEAGADEAAAALEAAWRSHFLADRQRTQRLADQAVQAGLRAGDALVELSARILQQMAAQRVTTPEDATARLQALGAQGQALGLPRVGWLANDALAAISLIGGAPESALQVAARTADIPSEQRSGPEQVHAELVRAVGSCWAGRVDAGLCHGYRLLHAARALGWPEALAVALSFLGDVQANRCGNDEDALPLLLEAQALLRDMPASPTVVNNLVNCVDVLQQSGRHDEARQLLQQGRAQHLGGMAWNRRKPRLALLYVTAGLLEEADECLADFAADAPGEPFQAWEWRLSAVLLHLARGEHAAALDMARAELARPMPVTRPARQLLRMHDAVRRCCEALGDAEGAAAALLAAQALLPPTLRDAAHARYLSLDLAHAPLQPAAARPADRRRLQAIDRRASQGLSAVPPGTAAAAAGAGVPRFVAHVTHELMTPVSGFMWLSEALLRSPLDETQRRHVQAMRRSAGDMLQLVNDVLDLARLERGLFQVVPAPLELRRWLAETFEPFAELGGARGLHMHLQLAPGLPAQVLADGLRLRQVLNNLLSNALKFTTAGSVTLAADWTPEATAAGQPERGRLLLAVHDTGRGIAPAVMQRLFAEFEQGDERVGREHGGFGLGLALCRQLLLAMGGQIVADSRPGQGSSFRVGVPLALHLAQAVAGGPSALNSTHGAAAD